MQPGGVEAKSEIRNSKFEANPKFEISNPAFTLFPRFRPFGIRACFGFRASCFVLRISTAHGC